MYPDLEVDADELRRTATALSGTAARVISAGARRPDPPDSPRWLSADAATATVDAARLLLRHTGEGLDDVAHRTALAADDYAEADARAAARLGAAR